MLELIEKKLDQIAVTIDSFGEGEGALSVVLRWGLGRPLIPDEGADGVGVADLAAEHDRIPFCSSNRPGTDWLPWGECEIHHLALGVDQGVDLGGQAAPEMFRAAITKASLPEGHTGDPGGETVDRHDVAVAAFHDLGQKAIPDPGLSQTDKLIIARRMRAITLQKSAQGHTVLNHQIMPFRTRWSSTRGTRPVCSATKAR